MQAKIKGILSIVALLAANSYAEELQESYTGPRPAALGGAFTALTDDHNALWTNAGGIGRVRKARSRHSLNLLQIPALTMGYNSIGAPLIRGQLGGTSSDEIKAGLADTSLEDNEAMWATNSTMLTAFFDLPKGSPNAGAIFSTTKAKLYKDDSDSDSALVSAVYDSGIAIGIGSSNKSNRLNFGITLRPTQRYDYFGKSSIEDSRSINSIQAQAKSKGNKLTGLGIDAGMMWTLADFWFPTLGLAIRNIPTGCSDSYLNPFLGATQSVCGTVFSGSTYTDSPQRVDPTDIRMGVAITPRLTRKVALRFSLDLHHLYFNAGGKYLGLSDVDPLKQLHGGLEFFLGNPLEPSPFSLRLGVNQGFISTGAGIRLGFLGLEVAYYGTDVSSEASQKEDKRILFAINGDFA